MDPARPADPDPADPFFPERADHAILETSKSPLKVKIAMNACVNCDRC
jgi:hypothetical protein